MVEAPSVLANVAKSENATPPFACVSCWETVKTFADWPVTAGGIPPIREFLGAILFTLWGRPSLFVVCHSCVWAADTTRSSAPRRCLVTEQYCIHAVLV